MLSYRPFRNFDPPALLEIWRSQNFQEECLRPITIDVLEQFVLSRLYFEQEGLILAVDGDRPVGFAHAGFGANEHERGIGTDLGVTCLILVRPDCPNRKEVASELLKHSESYLRGHNAKLLYGGGIYPLNPFYLGLYGGSESSGILATDTFALDVYSSAGYREIDRAVVFQCDLRHFLGPVSRQQMQYHRRTMVQVLFDPPMRSWWKACTLGEYALTRFELVPRGGSQPLASALVRETNPVEMAGPSRTVGLIELEVDPSSKRQGAATFLLVEIFRQLARQDVAIVEVQTMQHNVAALQLYRKLGFKQVNEGIVLRKEVN